MNLRARGTARIGFGKQWVLRDAVSDSRLHTTGVPAIDQVFGLVGRGIRHPHEEKVLAKNSSHLRIKTRNVYRHGLGKSQGVVALLDDQCATTLSHGIQSRNSQHTSNYLNQKFI